MKNLVRKLNGVFVGTLLSMLLLPVDVFATMPTMTDIPGLDSGGVAIGDKSATSDDKGQQPINIAGCWILVGGHWVYICHQDNKEAGNA